jgi:peptidoglycan hydrolase CwlO-like protein
MSEITVSKDALVKVKAALRDYQNDISSFTAKMKRQSSAISESAEFEMLKIDKQIESTENEIGLFKAKIDFLEDEIKKRVH